jgi:hypothetical protein
VSDTTFAVSSDVRPEKPLETVDHNRELRTALRRPIEAAWRPKNRVVVCDEDHALLSAFRLAFYSHLPLRLSPDAIWITLARGFALHVNECAEQLRHRFVGHAGKEKLVVERRDFLPGRENPWPEAFEAFRDQLDARTGGLTALVSADFSTTGPVERAVSHLMAMETFKSYFEYELLCGCGIPAVTLTGTVADWQRLREKARRFAEFGLGDWIAALDPVLAHFESAKAGRADVGFWKSLFRYNSGSGPAVLTGWANVLFPYLQDANEKLYPNPYLKDWKQRLAVDDRQHWRERWDDPQGVGLGAFPSCTTSVPLKVFWGERETDMRLVGGLLAVTQDDATLTVEPECGWVVVYEEPVDPRRRR